MVNIQAGWKYLVHVCNTHMRMPYSMYSSKKANDYLKLSLSYENTWFSHCESSMALNFLNHHPNCCSGEHKFDIPLLPSSQNNCNFSARWGRETMISGNQYKPSDLLQCMSRAGLTSEGANLQSHFQSLHSYVFTRTEFMRLSIDIRWGSEYAYFWLFYLKL